MKSSNSTESGPTGGGTGPEGVANGRSVRRFGSTSLYLNVIVGNAAWTLGSIALLFSGAVSPNLLGQVFIVAQAIATGVFAELQYVGLRKSGGVVAA